MIKLKIIINLKQNSMKTILIKRVIINSEFYDVIDYKSITDHLYLLVINADKSKEFWINISDCRIWDMEVIPIKLK